MYRNKIDWQMNCANLFHLSILEEEVSVEEEEVSVEEEEEGVFFQESLCLVAEAWPTLEKV